MLRDRAKSLSVLGICWGFFLENEYLRMKVTNILRWGCFGVVWRGKRRIFCILEPPYDVKIHKTVHRKTLGFFHEKFISWLIRKCAKKTFLMACALCNGNIGMEVCTISNDESHTFLSRYAFFKR